MTNNNEHIAIKIGNWSYHEPVLVRVHAQDEGNDMFGFLLETGKSTLRDAISRIEKEGAGLIVYMRHQNNLHSLASLFEKGKTKVDLDMDQRDFGVGAQILRELQVRKIKLLTNNPKKRVGLVGYDLEIIENISF